MDRNETGSRVLSKREAALEGRIVELEEAVRARDEFIAVAGHELRNPMTPIGGQVEMLLRAARRDPAAQDLVARIETLDRLIDTYVKRVTVLLDVARITSGQFHPELAEVDLSALLEQAVAAMAPMFNRAGAPVRLDVQAGVVGAWDRLALEQVVDNLLSNALKYGAGRPVEIALASDEAVARLTLQDNGIGISQEDQSRIFKRFERAVARRDHSGFGIGLWVSRQLLAAMDGDIAVSSTLGSGSTFTVKLPLRAI
jgi:signal transduction histidine kinase